MATVAKIGPDDHGRPMTWDEYQNGDYEEGYQYELIDGRLYVSPQANLPQGVLERWLYLILEDYCKAHSGVVNYVHPKARVFVHSRPEITTPEPDIAAYHDFPLEADWSELTWEDVSPLLVVEVVSANDPAKDLVRNVELYRLVRSIREYWIIDPRENATQPSLTVHRRHGRSWRVLEYPFGAEYTTRLLPGFSLTINPRA
jgi:Uma2 family endonuclease